MNKNNDRELPFEIPKYKKRTYKSYKKDKWKSRGLIMDNFDEIYQRYIYTKECDWCASEFKNTKDRHLDHCHQTGKFRGVLCEQCNHNANDGKHIYWDKSRNKYKVQIYRNGKYLLDKRYNTLEEAEIALKQFKDDNWWEFPWYVPNQ